MISPLCSRFREDQFAVSMIPRRAFPVNQWFPLAPRRAWRTVKSPLHCSAVLGIIVMKNKNAAVYGRANTRKPMQVESHLHNGHRPHRMEYYTILPLFLQGGLCCRICFIAVCLCCMRTRFLRCVGPLLSCAAFLFFARRVMGAKAPCAAVKNVLAIFLHIQSRQTFRPVLAKKTRAITEPHNWKEFLI